MTARNWIELLILSTLWGGSFFFVEVALQGLPTLTLVWCRVALAAVILVGALRIMGVGLPKRHQWPSLAVMGCLNNAVPFTLFVLAQGQITGSLAAILNATTPLFTVLVAHFATKDERLTLTKGLGVVIGFSGVVLMVGTAETSGEVWAKLACLMAAVSYGLASVWGRRFRKMGITPMATATGQVIASSLILLPIWIIVDRPWALPMPSLSVALAVLGLAVLSTAVAYLLFFRILASAGATNTALVTFLVPVSATVLGVLFLGDTLSAVQIAGFGLIAGGLVAIDGRMWRWIAA